MSKRNPTRSTPLTDSLIAEIAARLDWQGAKSAAARYAGISRQNLGKLMRERDTPRDSEVLLRLREFSRLPNAQQRAHARRASTAASATPAHPPADSPPDSASGETEQLPTWML